MDGRSTWEGPLCTPVLTFTARAHARFQLLEFQHQLLVISMTLYDIAKQHACVLSGSGMEKRGKWHAGETWTIRRDGRRRAGRLWEPGGGWSSYWGRGGGPGAAGAESGWEPRGTRDGAEHSPEDPLPPLAAVGELHEALHGGGSWAPREVRDRSAPFRSAPPRLTAEPSASERVSGRAAPLPWQPVHSGAGWGGGGRCHL